MGVLVSRRTDGGAATDGELACLLDMVRDWFAATAVVIVPDPGMPDRFHVSGTAGATLLRLACDLGDRLAHGGDVVEADPRESGARGGDPDPTGGRAIGFAAATRLEVAPGGGLGVLCVVDERPRDFPAGERDRLRRVGGIVAALLGRHRDARELAGLRDERDTRLALVREQAAELARGRMIFERACAFAKLGVWECDLLNGDALRWSDGVYDIFELPSGTPIDRERTLSLYTPESRLEMDALRTRAIEERSGFTFDARVVTAKGNERWMRITAAVEVENGAAVRLFGLKQDITAEKNLWERTWFLAHHDPLTGLANRSTFQGALETAGRSGGCLLLVDLDGFKEVNDTHGHLAGDECLLEIGERLRTTCAGATLVARLGGDEFAILLPAGTSAAEAERRAHAVVGAVCEPIRCAGHLVRIGASVGIAPAAGTGAADLYSRADIALYAAKRAGKNTVRAFAVGAGAAAAT